MSGRPGNTAVRAFRGFGSGRRVYVSGQVITGRGAEVAAPASRHRRRDLGKRLLDALRLAVSRRVVGARVRVECGDASEVVEADSHGFFAACLEVAPAREDGPWRGYRAELVAPAAAAPARGEGEVLMATAASRRVVVSDIDDTVMHTGVANKLMMLWRLFTHGAEDRAPLPGVAAFYRGLHGGREGDEENPPVYVSRSPWAIYPVLEAFFHDHEIPAGPVLELRDWGISLRHPFPRRARQHKREVLERVFEVFKDLPIVLVGDSGQRDPEVYAAIARRYPERVAAIYIRDLLHSADRSAALRRMQESLGELDVDLVLAASTAEMAVHARRRGWIPDSTVTEVREHVAREVP
ncbi:MAG: phosphatase domain-containing protein [Gammaproteobacteria bacterium]|nr:phosphatase domain-containing protein [Gammaproteobacteria bacterium]